MGGALHGVRVLDLSWGIAGPMTTMLLADCGADVVRVEPPGGDPFATQSGYRVWHRGKRSAVLDLKADDGRRSFLALAARSDVVVDSFTPGAMARLGLDHASLVGVNPRIVSLSITAYGDHPSHRDRPGYDGLVAARTGLLFDQKGRRGTAMEFISGRSGPEPEFDSPDGLVRGADRDGPVFPRTPWPSVGATYLATFGVVAALRAREVTGQAQRVTTSLLQGALAAACLNWQRVENPDAPLYWMWPVDARSIEGLYRCADGEWVHHWTVRPRWVLTAAEGDSLRSGQLDVSYRDDPDRIPMESDGLLTGIFLHPLLAEAFAKFPSHEWVLAAEKAGMGVAPVRSPAEALADKSFLADGCVAVVEDSHEGPIRHAGVLLDFSATPGGIAAPSPRRGEHTEEVMQIASRVVGDMRTSSEPTRQTSPLSYALEGVRVLDLGLGVAGPFTGRMLADLGADVIKVNALHDSYWNGTHMGLGTNRGKRSIALNLKDPAGREVLERLLATADVLTLNWRPGSAARLGLDYETLRARYPRLVYCSTRGYEKGPRSNLPGTDQTAAALTGTEWEDGACDAGNPPLWSRSNMGDTGNALLAAIAVAMALFWRESSGEGQAVSTSIVNAGLLHTSYAYLREDGSTPNWSHVDAGQYGLSPTYRMYRCAGDEWVFVAAVSPEHREALSELVSAMPAEQQPDELAGSLAAWCASRRAAEAWRSLDQAGVPAEVVDEHFCRDLFDDPEARRLGLVSQTECVSVGRFEDPGLLVGIAPSAGVVQRGPCASGEHTSEILAELGYAEQEVDALLERGAALDASGSRA
jgi:crotonobetainyl-CoA:carnitine CoA-transferase CaiB-like acyl-CoA transferase